MYIVRLPSVPTSLPSFELHGLVLMGFLGLPKMDIRLPRLAFGDKKLLYPAAC